MVLNCWALITWELKGVVRAAFLIPKAVLTTISFKVDSPPAESVIDKSLLFPISNSLSFIPVADINNTAPGFTLMKNFPLTSAETPVFVPLILTEAKGTGFPSSSVTAPVIVLACPRASIQITNSNDNSDNVFLMLLIFIYQLYFAAMFK